MTSKIVVLVFRSKLDGSENKYMYIHCVKKSGNIIRVWIQILLGDKASNSFLRIII